MKRNFITLCTMVLSLAVLSSCSKDNSGTQVNVPVTFKVSSEATKTHLVEGVTNWSKNDVIHIIDADGTGYKSDPISESGVVESEFTFSSFPATPRYALYVGRTQTPAVEDGKIVATLPVEQSMSITKSFCNHANLAIGAVEEIDETTYGATLMNVCGLMKFNVPSGIASVKIEGNNEEILSGAIYIDYNGGQPSWSVKEGEGYVNIIPRKNSEGVYQGSDYYACVLPQTFEKGITVTVTDADGNTAQRVGSNPLVLGRNKVVELPKLDMSIGDADNSVTLTFDFSDETIFPEGFAEGTQQAAKYDSPIMLKAQNGNQYGFICSGTVCKASSSSTGYCFVLYEAKQTMTFPQIDGKSLSQVTVYGGNASAKAVYLKNADGTTVSEKGLPSATDAAVMTPHSGEIPVSLYNNSNSTYISKLELVYE